ncbi:hypothetical protein QJQ45_023516 [Haematococcus lacustris]|nr:hypothetical protein QJQ45_023516 [Haematococcus lacustris]
METEVLSGEAPTENIESEQTEHAILVCTLLAAYAVLASTCYGWKQWKQYRLKTSKALSPSSCSPPPLTRLANLGLDTPISRDYTDIPAPPFSLDQEVMTTKRRSCATRTPSRPAGLHTLNDMGTQGQLHDNLQQGWDPALLQSCAHHKEAVSSLQGLQEDKEFQAYIRSKHGNLDLHMEQVEARLHTYRHLRTIDRGGFLFALSRSDVKEFVHRPAPRHLLVLEQVLTSVAVYACFLAILLNIPGGCGCLLGLLTAQTLFAWAASHPSLLARGLSLYAVRACPGRYPEHTLAAGFWRTSTAALVDILFLCATAGISVLVSLVLSCLLPHRQTCGQLLLGIHCEQEVSQPATMPQFSSLASSPHHQPTSDAQGTGSGLAARLMQRRPLAYTTREHGKCSSPASSQQHGSPCGSAAEKVVGVGQCSRPSQGWAGGLCGAKTDLDPLAEDTSQPAAGTPQHSGAQPAVQYTGSLSMASWLRTGMAPAPIMHADSPSAFNSPSLGGPGWVGQWGTVHASGGWGSELAARLQHPTTHTMQLGRLVEQESPWPSKRPTASPAVTHLSQWTISKRDRRTVQRPRHPSAEVFEIE